VSLLGAQWVRRRTEAPRSSPSLTCPGHALQRASADDRPAAGSPGAPGRGHRGKEVRWCRCRRSVPALWSSCSLLTQVWTKVWIRRPHPVHVICGGFGAPPLSDPAPTRCGRAGVRQRQAKKRWWETGVWTSGGVQEGTNSTGLERIRVRYWDREGVEQEDERRDRRYGRTKQRKTTGRTSACGSARGGIAEAGCGDQLREGGRSEMSAGTAVVRSEVAV
jgi:hypothetical protein